MGIQVKLYLVEDFWQEKEELEEAIALFANSQRFIKQISMDQVDKNKVMVSVIYSSKHDRE